MNWTLGSVWPRLGSNINERCPKLTEAAAGTEAAGCFARGASEAEVSVTVLPGRYERDRRATPAATSTRDAGKRRLHNRPVPNSRRFNLTCSSELFKSGGEE